MSGRRHVPALIAVKTAVFQQPRHIPTFALSYRRTLGVPGSGNARLFLPFCRPSCGIPPPLVLLKSIAVFGSCSEVSDGEAEEDSSCLQISKNSSTFLSFPVGYSSNLPQFSPPSSCFQVSATGFHLLVYLWEKKRRPDLKWHFL